MLILGLILSVFAIGFLCWLAFALAVHTLPLFIAITVGLAAYHHDAGLEGHASDRTHGRCSHPRHRADGLRAHAVRIVARADRALFCCPGCDGGLRGGFRIDPVECRLPPLVQRVWRGRRAPHRRDGVHAHDGPLPAL